MKVMGIHSFVHDSGACMASDGKVIAISEERLDRVKHSAVFPKLSIQYVLNEFGVQNINEVDLVVCDMFEGEGAETLKCIRKFGYRGRAESIRHHDAHAASSYFSSSFNDSAVMVVDGAGSNGAEYPDGKPLHPLASQLGWMQEVQSLYRGSGTNLNLIRRTFATPEHSLGIGFLYGLSSEYLGFDKLDGGKLMGLAPYGKKRKEYRDSLFIDSDGHILIPFDRSQFTNNYLSNLGAELFPGTKPRSANGPFARDHMDIAFYVQQKTEEAMLFVARNLRSLTASNNLCIAGGVGLNGPSNTLIAKNAGFKNVFIQPAASDAGIPLGCALYGYNVVLGGRKRFRMKHAFLGHEYTTEEISSAVKKFSDLINTDQPANIARVAAKAISDGKIVGFFYGASEFGPRALGNRSILADPRREDIKDILNKRVKFRESFRPFAPAVLEEYASEYFDISRESPFMLHIVRAKPDKSRLIPGALHVDGTARIQTVSKRVIPHFRSIIYEFYKLTGIPMLVNTSLNVSGEPIVETPEDAIRCLLSSGLDILVLRDWLIEKDVR